MGGPAWLTDIFAAASLAVAVYCAGRLVASPRWRRPTELDTDGAHVVMGVAMAGMLVSGLRTLPSAIWELVFAAGATWFGYRMFQAHRGARPSPWRSSHPLPHLVECAAMVFMFLILPASAAASRMTMTATEAGFSFLTLPLALFLFGYVVWLGDRVTLRAPALAIAPPTGDTGDTRSAIGSGPGFATTQSYLAPRCAAICKITMGITMGYMLVLML
jgi:drug/metabolite transporter (DMT)-like permease